MTDPYQCPKCRETLYKSENRLSKGGYMIPTNFYDGEISKRGENHICPKNIRMPKPKPVYVNEGSSMHEYMKNMARLGQDGYWHGWRDGKYVGRIEYAPNDWKSWEPEQEQEEVKQ